MHRSSLVALLVFAGLALPAFAAGAPKLPLVEKGGTIGECAQYGKWWPTAELTAYAKERDTSKVAFTIAPRERVQAVTGNVHTLAWGQVKLLADASAYNDNGVEVAKLKKGTPLSLIRYEGEGAYAVLHNGQQVSVDLANEMAEDGRGRSGYRPAKTEWWAQVKNAKGQVGWIRVDTAPQIWGKDGCGGPLPGWAK